MTDISHNSTLILTANQRLSRKLKSDYDQDQKQKGHTVWQTPAILPLNTWLETCFNTLHADVTLLSTLGEQILFEKIIENSAADYPLLPMASTAQLARAAQALLPRYQLQPQDFETPYTTEVAQFLRWSKQFHIETKKLGCMTSAELLHFLTQRIADLTLPEKITFVGFDDIPPALATFIDALTSRTTVVLESALPEISASAFQWSANHPEGEYAAMAEWVRTQLDATANTNIGIVTPDLSGNRTEILAALESALTPEQFRSVNMATGESLLQLPLIKTVLSVLNLKPQAIPFNTISELLRSPFINAPGLEAAAAAVFDWHLAQREKEILRLPEITMVFEQCSSIVLSDFPMRSERCIANIGPNRKQKPSEWTARFKQQLEIIGFPGQRALTANEVELLGRFEDILLSVNRLDALAGSITRGQALQYLRTACKQASFQPTVRNARVQVLGVLEATGWQFDALWLFQFNSHNWPRPARPNPLLPIALQKKFDLPHASAEREHLFAQKVTARLLQSAPNIMVSFSAEEQEQQRTISAFFRHLPMADEINTPISPLKNAVGSPRIRFEETTGPTLQPGETVRGGSALFTDQAICPFLSFAKHRLQATPWPKPESLFNAKLQGILVHAVLEKFWDQVKDQKTLHSQTAEETTQVIETVVAEVLKKNKHYFEQDFLQQLEHQRLVALLAAWIDVEKDRPFFTVVSKEKKLNFEFCGLSLNLRADRVDALSDGSQVIIDYKTGQPQPVAAWFAERLIAPQLPLYLQATENGTVRALAYAEVRYQGLKWKGVGERGDLLPGVIPIQKMMPDIETDNHWQTAVEIWKQQLEDLAHEFKQGFAAVQPIDESVCQDCEMKMLCRIREK